MSIAHLLGLLVLDGDDSLSLFCDTVGTSATGGGVLCTTSLHLVGKCLGTGLLSLGLEQ